MAVNQPGAAPSQGAASGTLPWRPGETYPLPITAGFTSQQIYSRACKLMGWSLREAAGAVATVELFSGGGTNGTKVGVAAFTANSDSQRTLFSDGVLVLGGLFFSQLAGSVTGAVYVKDAQQ